MKLEHIALNVDAPLAMSKWYCDHLGMQIIKQDSNAPYTTFMADSSERVMVEIYQNPTDQILNYAEMNPLLLHLAFVSEDPGGDKQRLLQAGASEEKDEQLPDGSRVIMLRDPWGVPIQLCKRAVSMLAEKERVN